MNQLVADTGGRRIVGDFIPRHKRGLAEFVLIEADAVGTVELRGIGEHQRVGEGPGLYGIGTDVLDLEPGLFHDFAFHRLFRGLTDLHKACNQRLPAIVGGVFCVAGQEQAIAVPHRDNDGRAYFRVLDETAVLAAHRALVFGMCHRRAAAPAEFPLVVKAV